MVKVFCFGTLKKGFGLSRFLASSEFLGYAQLNDYDLYEMSNGIPFVIKGTGIVYGEVYEVDKETLKVLDRIEVGYDRVEEKVLLDMEEIDVNVYTFNRIIPNSEKIEGGVY